MQTRIYVLIKKLQKKEKNKHPEVQDVVTFLSKLY